GAFAAGSGAGCYRGWGCGWWAGQGGVAEWSAGAVGDDEIVWGCADGDDAAVVQPVVIGADQHQVGQVGGAAVFPMLEVVGVQAAGGSAAGDHAAAVAVCQRAAQPPVDQPGLPPGADDLAVPFEHHLAGGVAGQVAAVVVA